MLKKTKAIVTLNIDNYAPELTTLTYPFMKRYAHKCQAEFVEITERKWPNAPVKNFEKFQMYDVAQTFDYTLFIDADALVLPECPDFSTIVPDNEVIFYALDFSPERFRPTIYTERDQRWHGAGTWLVGCTRYTADLWLPPTPAEEEIAYKNIFPTSKEQHFVSAHLIDDYQLTQNIARFGLRVWTVIGYLQQRRLARNWFAHNYLLDLPGKVAEITKQIDEFATKKA